MNKNSPYTKDQKQISLKALCGGFVDQQWYSRAMFSQTLVHGVCFDANA